MGEKQSVFEKPKRWEQALVPLYFFSPAVIC